MSRFARVFVLVALVGCTNDKPAEKKAAPPAAQPVRPAPTLPRLPEPEPARDRARPEETGTDEDVADSHARAAVEAERRVTDLKLKARGAEIEALGADLSYLDRQIASAEREVARAPSAEDRAQATATLATLRARRAETEARRAKAIDEK